MISQLSLDFRSEFSHIVFMHKLYLPILSLGFLAGSLNAEEDKIESRLIISTVCATLDDDALAVEKPNNYKEGASLTYQFAGKDIVSIEEDSLNLSGWTILPFSTRITKGGGFGYTVVHNSFYQGDLSDLKLDGSIIVGVGSEALTKDLTLAKGAEPVEFPDFTIEHAEDEDGNSTGITIKGELGMMKSLKVVINDKEAGNGGYSSSGKEITYYFRDFDEKSKVTIAYYTKINKETVKLIK